MRLERRYVSMLSVLLSLGLPGCGGGVSGGSGGSGTPASGVSILSPPSQSTHTSPSVSFVVDFDGEVRSETFEIRLDGDLQPPSPSWTVFASGASGVLSGLEDGVHLLRVTVAAASGEVQEASSSFEISTGGGVTRVSGLLLDPEGDVPIAGAAIYLEEDPSRVATTDASGHFELVDGWSGPGLHIIFDPRGLSFEDGQGPYGYPVYKRPVNVVAGAKNVVDVCYLPKVRPAVTLGDLVSQGVFDCTTQRFLEDYGLSNPAYPELEGTTLHIPAGTYVEFLPGGSSCEDRTLSIAPVDKAKAPSNLPPEVDPALLLTIQPTGMRFLDQPGGTPQPLPITLPNKDGLAAGNELILFSVDHALGAFIPKGKMQVDPANPSRLITIEGGVEGGSWHCSCPPGLPGEALLDGVFQCGGQARTNPVVDLQSGLLRETVALPPRVLFDELVQPRLDYDTSTIVNVLAARVDASIDVTSAVPDRISLTSTLDGIPSGADRFFDTSPFPENSTTKMNLIHPLDLSGASSGLLRYSIALKSHFPTSTATSGLSGLLPVRRIPDGAFGRGWALEGDDRLVRGALGDAAILHADGRRALFERQSLTPHGLRLSLYQDHSDASMLAFFAGQAPEVFELHASDGTSQLVTETTIPNIDFKGAGGAWLLHAGADGILETSSKSNPKGDDLSFTPPGGLDRFGGLAEGYLYLPFPADVVFRMKVDDAVALEIDGQLVASLTGLHSNGSVSSNPVSLPQGVVPFRIAFNDKTAHFHLRAEAQGGIFPPGQPISEQSFFQDANLQFSSTLRGVQGEFSQLVQLAGGAWERHEPDGAVARFDTSGRVVERSDRRGRTTRYDRDGSGRLLRVIDAVGGVTTLGYQGGHVTTIDDPSGGTTKLTYQGPDLVVVEDPDGARWTYGYDSRGLLERRLDPDGRLNRHEYDANGRFLRTLYPGGSQQEVDAASAGLLSLHSGSVTPGQAPIPPTGSESVAVHRDESNRARTVLVDASTPGVLRVRRASSLGGNHERVVDETYDSKSRQLLEQRVVEQDVGGSNAVTVARTTATWDFARGLPLEVTRHAVGSPQTTDRVTAYEWDAQHAWLRAKVEAKGTPEERRIEYVLDGIGNVNWIVPPLPAGPIRFDHDPGLGWALVKITDATGSTTDIGRSGPTSSTTSWTSMGTTVDIQRNVAGFPTVERRADGSTTYFGRDAYGRLLSVDDATGTGRVYSRHLSGRIESITVGGPQGSVHRFGYGPRGEWTSWSDPLGRTENRSYTPSGQLSRVIRRSGSAMDIVYDEGQRPVAFEYRADPNQANASRVTRLSYGPMDRVVELEDESSTLGFQYTPFGELESETGEVGAGSTVVSHSYDALGQRKQTQLELPSLGVVKVTAYAFDPAGRLGGLADSATGSIGFGYDGVGRRERLLRSDGTLTQYGHDGLGRLESVRTTLPGGALACEDTMGYDGLGRVSWIRSVRSLLPTSDVTTNFSYDPLGRLTEELSSEPQFSSNFGPFDARGNSLALGATYDLADQILSQGNLEYIHDAEGRLIEERDATTHGLRRRWTYDLRGRMTRVEDFDDQGTSTVVHAATYDARGRRIGVGSKEFVYDGDNLVGAYDQGTLVELRTHGPRIDELLASVAVETGTVSQWVSDAQGSPTQSLVGGQVQEEVLYSAFGRVIASTHGPFAVGFRGREFDAALGTYANRARTYDPTHGRFLSPEPMLIGALTTESPRGVNPYSYGWGDPLAHSDPSGLSPIRWALQGVIRWYRGIDPAIARINSGLFGRPLDAAIEEACGFDPLEALVGRQEAQVIGIVGGALDIAFGTTLVVVGGTTAATVIGALIVVSGVWGVGSAAYDLMSDRGWF